MRLDNMAAAPTAGWILIIISQLLVLTSSAEGEEYVQSVPVTLGGDRNSTDITGVVSFNVTWRLVLELKQGLNNNAIRVSTSSVYANLSFPLLISVRQGRHISSWALPFIEAGHASPVVSRTLCPLLNRPIDDNSTVNIIYIDISTPSFNNVSFNVSASIINQYQLRIGSLVNTNVHASSPVSYVFEYPEGVDRVLVKVTSSSNTCALVSVQEGLCPVDQLLDYPDHRGTFQTMQLLSAINMKRPVHQNFIYIVVSIYHHDNCSETNHDFFDGLVTFNTAANYNPSHVHDFNEINDFIKNVTIEIDHTLPIYRYWIAVGVSLAVLILFVVLVVSISFIEGIVCYRQHPVCSLLENGVSTGGQRTMERGRGSKDSPGSAAAPVEDGINPEPVNRPHFLSVLKGDHWYYEYMKRTTPSPRSPDFINKEFMRALHAPPTDKLILPSLPSDPSLIDCSINDCNGGCGHKSIDTGDASSVCSSIDPRNRLLEDFSDREDEGDERETCFTGEERGRVLRKVSGRKRDLSIVLEDTEGLSDSEDDEKPDTIEEEMEEQDTVPDNNNNNDTNNCRSDFKPHPPHSSVKPHPPHSSVKPHPPHSSVKSRPFSRKVLVLNNQYIHQLLIPEGEEFQKKYKGYWMYLSVIVIFYSLPVYQLMLTYQRFLSLSGNEDYCYYNSLCSHPLDILGISAFNNVWSNVSFLFLGILFLIIARRRRSMYRVYESINEDYERNNNQEKKVGVPQYFGIYYASGIALIGEALMSGAYHICPTGNNYQFDTTMMFVLVTLGIYQLFKSRNPDIIPSPHKLLLILSLLILFIALGVIYSGLIFYIIFFLLFVTGVFYTSLQIYYRWKIQFADGFVVLKELWYNLSHPYPPQHKPKAVYFCISVAINILFGFYGLLLQPVDFATYFLSIMIGNFIMSLIYYVVTKVYYKEFGDKKAILKSVLCLILAIMFWIGGALMYSVAVTDWLKSPAGSRDGNKECLLLGFYDSHDIWHFLSSFALFFSFLLLMTLDDNQEVVNRSKIHIF